MTHRRKVDPRTVSTLLPTPRRNRTVTGERTLREIELWVLVMVFVVVVAMSFGRANMGS